MKIKYKKRQLNQKLIFRILWLIMGLLAVFNIAEPHWTDYGYLIISLFYLGAYFYGKRNQCLTIENGQISMNEPFGKKINLDDIKQIRKFAGDYILKTEKMKLTINSQVIDPKSLVDLNSELEKLNLEWN